MTDKANLAGQMLGKRVRFGREAGVVKDWRDNGFGIDAEVCVLLDFGGYCWLHVDDVTVEPEASTPPTADLPHEVRELLCNAAFLLETVAHLQGREKTFLPFAEKLRFLAGKGRMPASVQELRDWLDDGQLLALAEELETSQRMG